ncbi:MAG: glycosyltransferase family 1 protein [Pseudomonadota bacterium]
MSRPVLLLDISRLVRRFEYFGGPTGIDRVDFQYARWLLRQELFEPMPVAMGRSGLFAIPLPAAEKIFGELERRWHADAPPGFGREDRSALRFYGERLVSRIARWRVLAGAHRPKLDGRRAVYLNVSQDGLDLPQNYAGLPCAKVALIHDVIPLTHPEYDTPRLVDLHRRRIEAVAAHFDHVIGISEATVDALSAAAGPKKYGTTIVPLAPALTTADEPMQFDRPTFVHLSTINRRKNAALILHVFRELAAHGEPPHLALVGRRGNDTTAVELIDRCPALQRVTTVYGALNDQEAAPILAGARALLTPSFAEGFGLPIVEAHAMGVPVVASDIPAHREVGGDGALYVSPLDGNGWRDAILSLARDEERAAALRSAIPRPRTWDDHFAVVGPLLADQAR